MNPGPGNHKIRLQINGKLRKQTPAETYHPSHEHSPPFLKVQPGRRALHGTALPSHGQRGGGWGGGAAPGIGEQSPLPSRDSFSCSLQNLSSREGERCLPFSSPLAGEKHPGPQRAQEPSPGSGQEEPGGSGPTSRQGEPAHPGAAAAAHEFMQPNSVSSTLDRGKQALTPFPGRVIFPAPLLFLEGKSIWSDLFLVSSNPASAGGLNDRPDQSRMWGAMAPCDSDAKLLLQRLQSTFAFLQSDHLRFSMFVYPKCASCNGTLSANCAI